MKRILFPLLCIIAFTANAQNIPDTAKKNLGDTIKKDLFTAPDTVKRLHSKFLALVPPLGLVTYGALSFAVHPVRNFDYYIRGEVAKSAPGFNSKAENYFQFAPIAIVYGLNLVGIEGKNRFIDRTALIGLSGGILGVTAFTLKHTTHRLRPNGQDYYSFPSGHTATAFAGAEFMAQEFSGKSPWYGVVAYSFAVGTGIFRLYNRDHWFSDVVAGAGFGILSTKAAYLVYPYLRNKLTHTSKAGKSTMIMPFYQEGTAGMSFAMEL